MDGDGAVSLRVGNASEDETIGNLVIIKEGLFGLINFSVNHLSGAGGAGTSTATVWKLNSSFFGGINDEDIIGTVDGGVDVVFLGDQLDRVTNRGGGTSSEGDWGESLNGGDGKESEDGLREHGDRQLISKQKKFRK